MIFDKHISLGKTSVHLQSPTFIIAEAGVNHGGNLDIAYKLIDVAVEAGANAVKFQAFRTSALIVSGVEKAPYQKAQTSATEYQEDMLRKLEMAKEHYVLLKNYCQAKGILFLITPFDEGSLQELEDIGVEAYKVASTDTTNLPFLKKIAKTGKPILLSTGMCYMAEIEEALASIYPYNRQVVLLQCTANYPIADHEANLNVLNTFKEHFDIILGYSDHSTGVGAAPYAVPMGAKVVEKHFTLDKSLPGPDHKASLSPEELKAFVIQIRQIETYMGSFIKKPTLSELGTRSSLQKCLVASRPLPQGHIISEDDIVAKRTGGKGISPLYYQEIVGKAATRAYQKDEPI